MQSSFFVIRGEKYLLRGPRGVPLWELTEMTSRKQILRLVSADNMKKELSCPRHVCTGVQLPHGVAFKVSCDRGLVL